MKMYQEYISLKCSRNSEAITAEFLENIEEVIYP